MTFPKAPRTLPVTRPEASDSTFLDTGPAPFTTVARPFQKSPRSPLLTEHEQRLSGSAHYREAFLKDFVPLSSVTVSCKQRPSGSPHRYKTFLKDVVPLSPVMVSGKQRLSWISAPLGGLSKRIPSPCIDC